MLDFSSALYLGFDHGSGSLPGWPGLTLGKPAVLEEVPGAHQARRELAALTGCEQVALGTSTLHLFNDLFGMLASRNDVAIWIDEAAYPIARWGSDRAVAGGVPVRVFASHDVRALRKAMNANRKARPVIVTDGFCPLRGEAAPLIDYARCAAGVNGLLIVDDTQALGVFGRPLGTEPFGSGGGGSIRRFGLEAAPGIVVVSSLAKALGVPVAMLGGSRQFVEEFHRKSTTLVHCSPPSAVTILAARQALELNLRWGNTLRRQLAERVIRFRRGLPGLTATGSVFPVQPLQLPVGMDARRMYERLLARGIQPVLHRDAAGGGPRISFVLSVRHRLRDIDYAVAAIAEEIGVGNFQEELQSVGGHGGLWPR